MRNWQWETAKQSHSGLRYQPKASRVHASFIKFYTDMYPDYVSITEGVFGTIKYFSLIGKDGEVIVNVLQKQADNPIHGAIPMLKVDSVAEWIAKIEAMGSTVVIPQMVCPCTQTYFAVMTDPQGNQMMFKEPKDHKGATHRPGV